MDKRKMKKLLILNLPYFLVGLFATNLGEKKNGYGCVFSYY